MPKNLNAEERAAVLALLADIAESDHRLRHRNAFELLARLCEAEVVVTAARTTILDVSSAAVKRREAEETAGANDAVKS